MFELLVNWLRAGGLFPGSVLYLSFFLSTPTAAITVRLIYEPIYHIRRTCLNCCRVSTFFCYRVAVRSLLWSSGRGNYKHGRASRKGRMGLDIHTGNDSLRQIFSTDCIFKKECSLFCLVSSRSSSCRDLPRMLASLLVQKGHTSNQNYAKTGLSLRTLTATISAGWRLARRSGCHKYGWSQYQFFADVGAVFSRWVVLMIHTGSILFGFA